MGGLSSPDTAIAAAPPPAELAPTGPQSPAPDAGSSPEDAAAAGISPESVSPSVVGEPTGSATGEPGADGAEAPQSAALTAEEQAVADALVKLKDEMQATEAAKTAEATWASMSYQEKVIDLSSNEVADENALALAIKAGDTELQTQLTEHLAKIRDQRRMLMLRDKRPPEEKIKEAKEYKEQAQISRDEARRGGNENDIAATQARLDGADRYVQVLEEEKKKSLGQFFLQLLRALGVTGLFLGGQAKGQGEAGLSGTSTGQGR